MKVTRHEWEVLGVAVRAYIALGRKGAKKADEDRVIAQNLLSRFKQELTLPKGCK